MAEANQDPLEFLRSFWGKLGFPLPGVVTPTVDIDELDKRIADLRAVEGWLKMNLGMLQMTIQGLEMQRATLAAWQSLGQAAANAEPPPNPFAQAGLWPWKFGAAESDKPEPPAKATRKRREKKSPTGTNDSNHS